MNIHESIVIQEAFRDGKTVRSINFNSPRISRGIPFNIASHPEYKFNFNLLSFELVKSGKERLIEDLEGVVGANLIRERAKEGKYHDE